MKSKLTTAVTSCAFVALMGAAVHADETTPPLVAQINSGNWLDEQEAQELRDELFYQRAAFFQFAYSSAPAMVMRTIGAGSK